MLDFFSIFTKGGLVLWYFQAECLKINLQEAINEFIRYSIIDKNSGVFHHNKMKLEHAMDNEFELVFVVGYQNFLKVSYIDKLLNEIMIRFRDQYKNELESGLISNLGASFDGFERHYAAILKRVETESKNESKNKKPGTFEESAKSKKTVEGSGLIEKKEWKEEREKREGKKEISAEEIEENKKALAKKFGKAKNSPTSPKVNGKKEKKTKQARHWDLEGKKNDKVLDYSEKQSKPTEKEEKITSTTEDLNCKGTMLGSVAGLEVDEIDIESEYDSSGKKSNVFGMFKGLIGQKELTTESMQPILEQYRLHLISKNVASEIASQIIDNVQSKLIGKNIGTFASIKKSVFNAIEESLVQILTPRRRVDILRDVLHAKEQGRPYAITFCGVNGVGKSTNLAKIAFWLVENGFRIMIAACDTFRAGAIEQLRTHSHRINGLHPDSVQVFQQGYGKDAATIAMHAISAARDQKYDVVLIDTAGRMQDNTPLMRALSKLIAVNRPDLVLFVGEALVGNDAVDQLTKFNEALANHSNSKDPRLIDGIVLSKFDTIDDKVGAAISMTYTTGQPIVFIGTGQTYADLKSLNPRAVVNILLR